MHPNIAYWQLLVSIVLLGLTGCAGYELRTGPSPVIDGAAAESASGNKALLLNALATDAGFGPNEPVVYYTVAEAGFNYVDDQCRAYFDHLFFLDRRRDEAKSGLAAGAQTTAAILGITGAAVPTLTIVAQAFGIASAATDIVAGTYLYRLPPATTQGFVEKLQLAYREAAAANRTHINTPTSAYYHIQRYLNLCLPPTIEAEITRQISSAGAVAVPAGPGAFFDVQSVGAPVSTLPKVGVAPGFFPKTGPGRVSPGGPSTTGPSHPKITGNTPLGGTFVDNVPGLPGARGQFEKEMSPADLARIQRDLLCLPENPKFDPLTREGITIYQQARSFLTAQEVTGQIDGGWKKDMDRMDHGKPCPKGAQNFYELTRFFDRGNLLPGQVRDLQQKLNARLEGVQIPVNEKLDPATREKIAAVSKGMKDLTDPPSAKGQVTLPFINELGR